MNKQKKSTRKDFAIQRFINDGIYNSIVFNEDILTSQELQDYCIKNNLEKEYKETIKINHASYKRTTRLKHRIEKMLLSGICYFITLTFNDNVLNNTTAETRKKYVKNYLKEQSNVYVANIDFGSKNGREHYHSLLIPLNNKIQPSLWHKNGAINIKKVKANTTNPIKLAKYIAKLTNHAVKETTKRTSIIYSR